MADKLEKKEETPGGKARAQPSQQDKEDKDPTLNVARREAFRAIVETMFAPRPQFDKLTLREVLARTPTAGELGLASALKLQDEISKLRRQVQEQTQLLTEEKTSAQEKARHHRAAILLAEPISPWINHYRNILTCGYQDPGCSIGKLPAERWERRGTGGAASIHGRAGTN